MLGWAIKKGIQGATGARDAPPEEGDTTQFEAPDTPAPVVAARAIKHAIFGTPAPPKEQIPSLQVITGDADADTALLKDSRSPSKPTGILLTPGTATARRKRVSFDHDVKAGTNADSNTLATDLSASGGRRKTIQQRLEESRSNKSKQTSEKSRSSEKQTVNATPTEEQAPGDSDSDWEDDMCSHDVTVDLNEPHSRSGKYWKSEFSKYSDDARAEMEKLVKYKHLAKCYAQKKDAEAVELNQKLKEEREKVASMEKKISEITSRAAKNRPGHGMDIEDDILAQKLSDRTAQAVEYKNRIKELEAQVRDLDKSTGKSHRGADASPRSEKTLLETSRELRRARSELRELRRFREENERLKSDLQFAEQRASKLGDENKRVAADSTQPSWVQKVEKQLRSTEEQLEHKDAEYKKLKKEFETLKENAKSSRSQALQVLKEKNDRIAELEKQVRSLEEKASTNERTKALDAALARHNQTTRDLKSGITSMNKPSIHEKARLERPKRSVSAEDLTIDFTQQSLFDSPSQKVGGYRFPVDLTDSMRDIEEQLRNERRERMESRRRNQDLVTAELDVPALQSLGKSQTLRASRPPAVSHRRVMSDRVHDTSHSNIRDQARPRGSAGQSDRPIMRDALDNLTNSRYTAKLQAVRAASPEFGTPGFDLLQNRFAKLGGPNINDTLLSMNASRCTLPADRQAAARARLEQKRRGKRIVSDKENMRP